MASLSPWTAVVVAHGEELGEPHRASGKLADWQPVTRSWFLVCALPLHSRALTEVEGSPGDALWSVLQVQTPGES